MTVDRLTRASAAPRLSVLRTLSAPLVLVYFSPCSLLAWPACPLARSARLPAGRIGPAALPPSLAARLPLALGWFPGSCGSTCGHSSTPSRPHCSEAERRAPPPRNRGRMNGRMPDAADAADHAARMKLTTENTQLRLRKKTNTEHSTKQEAASKRSTGEAKRRATHRRTEQRNDETTCRECRACVRAVR